MLSKYAENIKNRYDKHWITDIQLIRFCELGAITKEEYKEISGKDFVEAPTV